MTVSRICILLDYYKNPYAGTEGQVLTLVRSLLARGVEVRMAVLRSSEYIASGAFPAPVDVLDVGGISRPASWWRLLAYARKLKAQGFGLVHVFFNDASIMAPPVFKLLGFKVVISRRDMGFWYTPGQLALLRLTRHCVDRVVCNSKAVSDITAREERFASSQLAVIYNGFPPHKESQAQITSHRAGGPVIGVVANFRPIKRLDDLVRAFAKVSEAFPSAELHMIGGGDDASCRALVSANGLDGRVKFFGAQADVASFIDCFDVAVLCSESEGFSNAIIEYMQAAKPVVCSAVGGNPELVTHGTHGLLYPMGDVAALAACLEQLMRDPLAAAEMGRNGRNKVVQEYSQEKMAAQHMSLYGELTG